MRDQSRCLPRSPQAGTSGDQHDAKAQHFVGYQCQTVPNVYSKRYTATCMPTTGMNFPRTAESIRLPSGLIDFKYLIQHRSHCSPTSFSKVWDGIRRRAGRKDGIKVHTVIHANEGVPSDIHTCHRLGAPCTEYW